MGFFSKLLKGTVQTISTPIDVVKDVATMGGVLTDREESYTLEKLRKISETAEKMEKDIEDENW